MPTPPPPNHAKWKKGQSGNPEGRPPDPPELKRLKNLTKRELVDLGNLVVKGDVDTLRKLASNGKSTALVAMVAAVCERVIREGDMQKLDILLNRLIGRVKEEVQHSGEIGGNGSAQVIVTLPSNGKEAKS